MGLLSKIADKRKFQDQGRRPWEDERNGAPKDVRKQDFNA